MKLNNKGFAITTILFGTFIIFIILFVSLLGIMATEKNNLQILIENTNGCRDEVTIKKDSSNVIIVNSVAEQRGLYCIKESDSSECGCYKYLSSREKASSCSVDIVFNANGGTFDDGGIVLTNILKDTSFEDGITNFIGYENYAKGIISQEYSKYGSNSFKFSNKTSYTGDDTSGAFYVQSFTGVKNHKYLYMSDIYKTGNTNRTLVMELKYFTNVIHEPVYTSFQKPEGDYYENSTELNVWKKRGHLWTVTIDDAANSCVTLGIWGLKDSDSDEVFVYYDGLILVDLTEAYGEGKEPSISWLLDNIDYFTGDNSFKQKSYTTGKAFGEFPNASKSGSSFQGWFTASGDKIETSDIANGNITKLYAHWA